MLERVCVAMCVAIYFMQLLSFILMSVLRYVCVCCSECVAELAAIDVNTYEFVGKLQLLSII